MTKDTSKKPGRPQTDTKVLQVIVSKATAERIKAIAKKRGQSVSGLLAEMTLLQLDKYERM